VSTAEEKEREMFKGRPIADEFIEELADEAERGYDLVKLERRPDRPPIGSDPGRRRRGMPRS
jgi:hypothetical protein